jgi:hypothetical protein
VELEIWLDIVCDPSKPNIGFGYIRGQNPVRAVLALNRSHYLVERSLSESDTKTTTWLVALLLVESLTFNLRNPFAKSLLKRWKALLPEGKDKYRYLYLGNQLAEKSKLLAGIPGLPIFGADPASTPPHMLGSLVVAYLQPAKLS